MGACPSKYNTVDKTVTEEQCPDGVTNLRYCAATALNVTIKTKGEAGAVMAMAETATPTCYHEEDTVDHKCFEACATADFKSKGITVSGACPSKYNTVDKTVTEEQCPDGVTNLRYCAATALNVTIKTKGEAGAASVSMVQGVA